MSDSRTGVKDPLVSFAFKVEFDGAPVALVSGVDGLSKEVEMIEYRDAATPNMPHFRQGRRKAPRITLKRAYLNGGNTNKFFEWIAEADNGEVKAKNVTITVGQFGPSGIEERDFGGMNAWVLSQCKPAKWSISSLDGTSKSLIFESIELVCEEVRLSK